MDEYKGRLKLGGRQSPPPSFAQQVRERLASPDRRGHLISHPRTPAVMRLLGFPALPLAMAPGVLAKIATGKWGERAPLAPRQIERLPEMLDEAAAVFRETDGASVIVLSTECDEAEKPIVVCVRPRVPDGLRYVNLITTAFGKDNATEWATRMKAAVVYIGEKTNPRLPLPGLIYYQTGALETEGSTRMVLGPEDLRKFKQEAFAEVQNVCSGKPELAVAQIVAATLRRPGQ